MSKDIKIMFAAIGFTLLLIVGFALLVSKQNTTEVSGDVAGAVINPENFDLGDVPINGGIVTKEYEVKNTAGETLKLKKVATSCMCTMAKVVFGDKETKFFGMEGHGDKNAPVNLEIPSGQSARVVVNFDPAAHGPEGVGPFERIVWLTFSDPAGVKELWFEGTVVK